MATKNVDPDLKRAMKDSLAAYARGDAAFFDFLDDDVRVYTLDSAEPIVGRKRFQEYFGATLGRSKREIVEISQDIRPSGEYAVLSQTLQISTEGVGLPVKQTVVWARQSGRWQMTHLHNGRAGQPIVSGQAPRTIAAIRVLNERIATVAATVGVAQ